MHFHLDVSWLRILTLGTFGVLGLLMSGCTITLLPMEDTDLEARVASLEERVTTLEEAPHSMSEEGMNELLEQRVALGIQGISEDGDLVSLVYEDMEYIPYDRLNGNAFRDMKENISLDAQLEYALVHSGTGTDWDLFYTQIPTEIVTGTQVTGYRSSKEEPNVLLSGPQFSLSNVTQIPDLNSGNFAWESTILHLQEMMGGAPPGAILPRSTALFLLSEQEHGQQNYKLIIFLGIRADGVQDTPHGIADILNACCTCEVDCRLLCGLVK
ncbi:MAG: hypothetical protein AAF702_09360 [Chloroflexota bacterium]